ncbi:unnamed protein product [Prunus armeniaca]|uniref:Uncharacterized protein n=1 Tax=Prunus armeniaca TaxID=36596 RepID=A0A6J5TEP5_PRUAR|nr:unnamed protein product [Prunus armeniaca]CAB4292259.1 unnamed protein product [Prunus armeniaca]
MGLVNFALAALLLLCLLHVQPNKAGRILYAEARLMKHELMNFQSLPRGDLPPSESSRCTYIPGTGGSGCPLKVKNYAGHGLSHHASAYPRLTVPFGVATNHK